MSKGYPKYHPSSEKGELGVQLVSRVVTEKLKWIFKRNPQEFDFGIDGQIEILRNDSSVTGQLVAVQIKYGKSFFKEKNRWGYVYRGELKHFNYLSNYPLPVLILICDPQTKNIYWEKFDPRKTERTKKAWKINIPSHQILPDSKNDILRFLSKEIDYLSELEVYWGVNEVLKKHVDNIHFIITPDDVEKRDVSEIFNNFKRLMTSKELAFESQGRVDFSFMGYDDDPRELFEITEVVAFTKTLALTVHELFFFCDVSESSAGLKTIALCHADARLVGEDKKQVEINYEKLTPFVTKQINGLNSITDWLGMSIEENKRITYEAFESLGVGMPDEY